MTQTLLHTGGKKEIGTDGKPKVAEAKPDAAVAADANATPEGEQKQG